MSAGIDARRLRDLMAGVCAPVTVVTVADGAGAHGATVSSFASLSLDPPLVTIALDERSGLLPRLLAAGRFGVNLLGHGQGELALRFARPAADRFAGVDWHLDGGLPRLAGAAGRLMCEVHGAVPGGDHRLLTGHVVGAGRAELAPLVYAHRTFGTHSRFDRRPRTLVADQIAACAR